MPSQLPESPHTIPGHPDWRGFDFTSGGIHHIVYWKGPPEAPGVLVMHELPGLANETVAFGNRLVAAGYRVFMPLLFGDPIPDFPLQVRAAINYRRLCMNAEFAKLEANVTAPLTKWLRALANEISAWCGDRDIGAIGMCLTGGFVIPLILEQKVAAPITCQPSVPLPPLGAKLLSTDKQRRALNVAPTDLALAADAIGNRTLLGFRFTNDWKCPAERFETIRGAFADAFDGHQLNSPDEARGVPKNAHSVLTYAHPDRPNAPADHPSLVAFRTVLEFLDRRLKRSPA